MFTIRVSVFWLSILNISSILKSCRNCTSSFGHKRGERGICANLVRETSGPRKEDEIVENGCI